MPLTDISIRNAKPLPAMQKLSDGGGLQLWVTPAGGKVWKLAYRFDGAQKTLTLEHFPIKWMPVDDQKMRQNRRIERPT